VVPALHQDLCATERDCLIDFFIDLIEGDHIGIVVFFGAIKRAEFAINIANVGVVNVPVNDVGDNFVAPAVVGLFLGELTPSISQRAQIFERQMIKLQCLGFIHPPTVPDLLHQFVIRRFIRHGQNVAEE